MTCCSSKCAVEGLRYLNQPDDSEDVFSLPEGFSCKTDEISLEAVFEPVMHVAAKMLFATTSSPAFPIFVVSAAMRSTELMMLSFSACVVDFFAFTVIGYPESCRLYSIPKFWEK